MNNKRWMARRTTALILGGLFFGSLYFSSAYGFGGGVTGSSTSGCAPCHSQGPAELLLGGPNVVTPDSTHTYTFSIFGGPAVVGGLDISAEAGALSTVDVMTQLMSGEITHSSPKAFSGGMVSWDFDWTAPSVVGAVNLFAAGLSANGDFGPGGDYWATTFLTVEVVPIPAAALLFTSALALLGWARRRRGPRA